MSIALVNLGILGLVYSRSGNTSWKSLSPYLSLSLSLSLTLSNSLCLSLNCESKKPIA